MNESRFQFAGWVAAVSAALTIPLFAFQVLAARGGPTLLSMASQIVSALLLLYVLSSLRILLTQKQLTAADTYLAAIIGVTLCVQIVALFANALTFLALPLLAGLVALGVLYIVAGIKLLNHASALPGLRLFSLATIFVGVCTASIVLALLVLPASMVMNIALAIVFFREAGVHATDTCNGQASEREQ